MSLEPFASMKENRSPNSAGFNFEANLARKTRLGKAANGTSLAEEKIEIVDPAYRKQAPP